MVRKKKIDTPRLDDAWDTQTELQINGRWVYPGTELKIAGERGRFRFIKFVTTDKGASWIDVWGGTKNSETWRSFRLEQVKTVHYKNRTTENLAKEYKEKLKEKRAESE